MQNRDVNTSLFESMCGQVPLAQIPGEKKLKNHIFKYDLVYTACISIQHINDIILHSHRKL